MYFHSISFALFLPTAVAGYWLLASPLKRWWLIGMSYIFYMGTFPKYALLLFAVTTLAYVSGLTIARWPRRRTVTLSLSISASLGILLVFKYAELIRTTFASLVQLFGGQVRLEPFTMVAPIGLSFYLFIAMSYTIDCYRGSVTPIRDFSLFASYLSFFPQLLAGPIVRPGHLLPQLSRPAQFDLRVCEEGIRLFILGICKKVLIADNLAPVVDYGFSRAAILTAPDAWVSLLAFTFQIYFDFSGYTDCARGCAKLFGYELPENFFLPYLASSPREFWRRWHVTLSTWLRDYLYIPLGGNRCSRMRMYANLMITMALGGLWHGAAWTFFFWGIYHGLLLVLQRAITRPKQFIHRPHQGLRSVGTDTAGRLVTFLLIAIGWVLFRASSLDEAVLMYSALIRWGEDGRAAAMLMRSAALPAALALLAYHGGKTVLKKTTKMYYPRAQRLWTWSSLIVLIITVLYLSQVSGQGAIGAPKPFIYFQF